MKAAVLIKQNHDLVISKLNYSKPIGYQVLVDIKSSGICGAQLNEIQGIKGADKHLPHLMGHEGSGIVIDIGGLVTKLKIGDNVVMHWRKSKGGEGPFPKYENEHGQAVGGGFVTTFASRALIAENRLTKIDKDIPFDVACLFGCGISTGYGIIFNELKPKVGSTLAVIGCGGVGLNVIHAASILKLEKIFALDRHANLKSDLCLSMGANEFLKLDSVNSLPAILLSLSKTGIDYIVDTTGNTDIMSHAFDCISKNGTLMLVGQPRFDTKLTLNSALDLFTGKKIIISEGGGFDPDIDIIKLAELYRNNPASMRNIITHTFNLDNINEAINTCKLGQCGRVLIDMT